MALSVDRLPQSSSISMSTPLIADSPEFENMIQKSESKCYGLLSRYCCCLCNLICCRVFVIIEDAEGKRIYRWLSRKEIRNFEVSEDLILRMGCCFRKIVLNSKKNQQTETASNSETVTAPKSETETFSAPETLQKQNNQQTEASPKLEKKVPWNSSEILPLKSQQVSRSYEHPTIDASTIAQYSSLQRSVSDFSQSNRRISRHIKSGAIQPVSVKDLAQLTASKPKNISTSQHYQPRPRSGSVAASEPERSGRLRPLHRRSRTFGSISLHDQIIVDEPCSGSGMTLSAEPPEVSLSAEPPYKDFPESKKEVLTG